MGLLDSLFGGKRPPPEPLPADLRGALFDLAAAGAHETLARRCADWQDEIARRFPEWTTVPPGDRDDEAKLRWYGEGLVAVATAFQKSLGRGDLMARLVGDPATNPLQRWEEGMARAQAHLAAGRHAEARAVAEDLLIDMRGLRGPGIHRPLAITHGLLGQSCFEGGAAGQAIAPLERALALCEGARDDDGVAAYLRSLHEVHRWLGHGEAAGASAERLAALEKDEVAALRWRRRAALAREGEPLLRAIARVGGRLYELRDAPPPEKGTATRVEIILERNRIPLSSATRLVEQGQAHGREGAYADALASLREAAKVDPHDPRSRYLEAFTLVHMGRAAEAVGVYEEVERLAPAWYDARSDHYLACRVAVGALDLEGWKLVHALCDAPKVDPRAALDRLDALAGPASALRDLPALHLLRGELLAATGDTPGAEAALRSGLTLQADDGIRTRLLAGLGFVVTDAAERMRLLEEAAALRGHLIAAAMAEMCLRR